ncbi:MAG TPA: hypothetical protein VFY89_10330 [Ktedonobacterales bacterium]
MIGMGARHQRVVPRSIGFVLIAIGFLAFVGSYFLLPIYSTTFCFDYCPSMLTATAWEFSLKMLASFSLAPVFDALLLMLLYLPLLAALVVLGSSLGFLARPARAFAIWIRRGCLAGSIALAILLLPLSFFVRPDIGYLVMLAGYALFWGGYALYLTAHPAARYEP